MLYIEHRTIGSFLLVPATTRPPDQTCKQKTCIICCPGGSSSKKKKGNLAGMRSPQTQRRRTLGPDDSMNKDHPQGRLLCVREVTQGHPVHILFNEI